MTCPPKVAEILLAILGQGLLQVRAFGWSGDANRAAIEADHLHNLPTLLAHYSPALLDYYWTAERPGYIAQVTEEQAEAFRPYWDRLRRYMESMQTECAEAATP